MLPKHSKLMLADDRAASHLPTPQRQTGLMVTLAGRYATGADIVSTATVFALPPCQKFETQVVWDRMA